MPIKNKKPIIPSSVNTVINVLCEYKFVRLGKYLPEIYLKLPGPTPNNGYCKKILIPPRSKSIRVVIDWRPNISSPVNKK